MPLIALANPVTFDPDVSFSSIFGPDPNTQLVMKSWEFYVNKTTETALLIYVDNVEMRKLLPGDATCDGLVNTTDFNVLAANFGGNGKNWVNADFSGDGNVDTTDFNFLAGNFGKSSPPSASALGAVVPEPATGTMIGASLGAVALKRRRRSM